MIYEEVIRQFTWKKKISYEASYMLHKKLEDFLEKAAYSQIPLIPTKEVDEMWHNFILHTRLYYEYCESMFGKFIHHNPQIKAFSFDCNSSSDDDEREEDKDKDGTKCDSAKTPLYHKQKLKLVASADCSGDSGDNGSSGDSEGSHDAACDSQYFPISTQLKCHDQ